MHPKLSLHTVPSSVARLYLRVVRDLTLPKALADTSFLLALSGGSDSTALACIFAIIREKFGVPLSAAIIDHGLRPEAADEIAGTQALCARLELPLVVRRCDVPAFARETKLGEEASARYLRYALLEEERRRRCADYIVTAHQANDRAEDILLRLTRGTGWPALGGLLAIDETRHLLRPLLNCTAEELKEMLRLLAIPWYTDASNFNCAYTRNRFRHTIVPVFLAENPKFLENMGHLAAQAARDRAYFAEELGRALNTYPWSFTQTNDTSILTYSRTLLNALHPAARMRLYRIALASLRPKAQYLPSEKHASYRHFERLEHVVCRGISGKCVQFPGPILATLSREGLTFLRHTDACAR